MPRERLEKKSAAGVLNGVAAHGHTRAMAIRSFDPFFAPRSVALVGASDHAGSVGALTLANLRSAGFTGALYLVNPKHTSIDGLPCYPDAAALPSAPDLAVIATPPDQVPDVVTQFGEKGTLAAVIITAGFAELGERGAQLQRDTAQRAAHYGMRIVGPNCIGVMVPKAGLNASFGQLAPLPGNVAFVSQSGALVDAVLDWAQPRGIGFSKVVSLGDMADVDFGDLLAYLSTDSSTSAILLYIEGLTNGSKFLAAARIAAAVKPVVVLKVGRHAAAAKAARSHTGALAGSDAVYDTAFRRAGMLRVDTMPEMFDAVETLALTEPQQGERVTIVTNGGGPGVLATDALISRGGALTELSPQTIEKLSGILRSGWSHGNPIDMVGDAGAKEYRAVLDVLLAEQNKDAIVVLNCPTALADPAEAAKAVIDTVSAARGRGEKRNILTAWLGERSAAASRLLFDAAHIPTYDTAEDAVDGFMYRARFRENQALLQSPVRQASFNGNTVAGVVARARQAGRRWLDSDEVDAVLKASGVPTPLCRNVPDAASAAAAAEEMNCAVALKLRSPDVVHKSDAGAVALNLRGAKAVLDAANAMLARIKSAQPDARIEGFFVQQMIDRPGAYELIAGLSTDAVFGPVVLFGAGGTAVEAIADTSLELAPLNRAIALAQMQRTRIWRLLRGYRNRPPAQNDAIADVLVRLGNLIVTHPDIKELDINPLLSDAQGVLALDARIAIA